MRRLEKILCVLGLAAIVMGASQIMRYRLFQVHAEAIPLKPSAATHLLGQLYIPRLHLVLPILDNDDASSLALSVGHIPGTSVIGSLGNAGIAGHRDTSFRPLRNIKIGDRIETHTGQSAVYIVRRIRVVDPSDTSLLRESTSPLLTLVTCYPFNYVGSAPRRFVIQAQMTAN